MHRRGLVFVLDFFIHTNPPPSAKCGGIVLAGVLRSPTSSSTYSTYTIRCHSQTLHSFHNDPVNLGIGGIGYDTVSGGVNNVKPCSGRLLAGFAPGIERGQWRVGLILPLK